MAAAPIIVGDWKVTWTEFAPKRNSASSYEGHWVAKKGTGKDAVYLRQYAVALNHEIGTAVAEKAKTNALAEMRREIAAQK